jgi:hypothetical protein
MDTEFCRFIGVSHLQIFDRKTARPEVQTARPVRFLNRVARNLIRELVTSGRLLDGPMPAGRDGCLRDPACQAYLLGSTKRLEGPSDGPSGSGPPFT